MSKKTDLTAKLLDKIQTGWPIPEKLADANLLEQGLYAILRRKLDPDAARAVVVSLRSAYSDWNEMRVAQAQEVAGRLSLDKKRAIVAARETKEYLQEVFQRSHGLNLEFLRDDAQTTQRFVSILPYIGLGTAHYLMWLASDEKDVPVTLGLVRVLDRVGLVSRQGSPKKSRAAIDPLVPKGRELDFAIRIGEVASRWCDARKPLCYACPLVDDCRYGKKAFREWQVQQKRLEQQRQRDEVRRALLAKKEEERRKKEDEKRRREQERLFHKRQAEEQKKKRDQERIAKAEQHRREVEGRKKAREDAARKKVEEIARRKAEAAAKKVAAAKKEAERKAAAAKAAAKEAAKKAAKLAKAKAKAKKPAKRPKKSGKRK